jgi:DNA-binding MarR family transcriptional regulator
VSADPANARGPAGVDRATEAGQRLDLPADDKARLRLWLAMLRATRGIENELRARLSRSYDTTLPRFDVMAALYRRPDGLKMSELSRMLMVSSGNVTGIVHRLLEDGLIERDGVEGDRRAVRVRLSARGWDTFTAMAVEHAAWIEEMMAGLDADDVSAAMQALLKIDKPDREAGTNGATKGGRTG